MLQGLKGLFGLGAKANSDTAVRKTALQPAFPEQSSLAACAETSAPAPAPANDALATPYSRKWRGNTIHDMMLNSVEAENTDLIDTAPASAPVVEAAPSVTSEAGKAGCNMVCPCLRMRMRVRVRQVSAP